MGFEKGRGNSWGAILISMMSTAKREGVRTHNKVNEIHTAENGVQVAVAAFGI